MKQIRGKCSAQGPADRERSLKAPQSVITHPPVCFSSAGNAPGIPQPASCPPG